MRVSVDRHDRVTKIVFYKFETLAAGRVVTVNVRLLTKYGSELCVGV